MTGVNGGVDLKQSLAQLHVIEHLRVP